MESFLEKRCRMMENLDQALVTQTSGQQVGKNLHKYNQNTLIAPATDIKSFATFILRCTGSCSPFLNLSPNLRYREAKKFHLCLNFLRKGHSLQQCRSTHYKYCCMKHPQYSPHIHLHHAIHPRAISHYHILHQICIMLAHIIAS